VILNKVTRSKSTGGFHTCTDVDRKYHFNIMALASDIRATKETAQALYCLHDKEEKRKTNKFKERKKDFKRADYNFFVSRNKNEPESLSNPNYLVEEVGEYTEARVSDCQRRPDRCMTNLKTSQQVCIISFLRITTTKHICSNRT